MALQDGVFSDTWIKKMRGTISFDLGDTTPGTYVGALFTGSVSAGTIDFDAVNPAYGSGVFASNEASGPGYTAGGEDLTVSSFAVLVGSANKVGWVLNDILWTGTTITAEGLLIYIPGLSDRALMYRHFGQAYPTSDGNFEVGFHADGAYRERLRAAA
ncbi:hypothetical protein HS041_22360 [Planomonospora sp. ID67723]|uniref:hypothetical protein n=1 Tax=Planomonospora sp. ID67723 TaxID=2738134 RepID=UPI0018C3D94D|nr:hypothetical protein [Planomonospora sp. ID67723]MBG0830508.1 hypothetical protein [Planomonospora sp. ID67723]